MNNQAPQGLRRYRMHLKVIVASAAFGAIFLSIALAGFHQPTPHGLRVALVAPAPLTRAIPSELNDRAPGAFEFVPMTSERQARLAITARRVAGAAIVSPSGMDLLTAAAGGTAPAQALASTFGALAAGMHEPIRINDVVAPAPGDSQGLSSYFLVLCVLFPSLAAGSAAGHVLRRAGLFSRVLVLVEVAALIGLAAAGIADGITGLGHYWAIAGIVALFSLAISAPTAALGQLKPPLVGLSVLMFLMFGIPASGGPANLAAFEPGFLRWLQPGLPLGIATDTIRNTVYFHANDTAAHLWVLSAFAAAGVFAICALSTAGRRHRTRPAASLVDSGTGPQPAAVETAAPPTAAVAV